MDNGTCSCPFKEVKYAAYYNEGENGCYHTCPSDYIADQFHEICVVSLPEGYAFKSVDSDELVVATQRQSISGAALEAEYFHACENGSVPMKTDAHDGQLTCQCQDKDYVTGTTVKSHQCYTNCREIGQLLDR